MSSSLSQASAAEHELKIWSCVTCRRRKVKCDRRDPCNNCIRNKTECHFPITGRLPRRSKEGTAGSSSKTQRQAELLGRLRRLEDLVTELSGQLEDGAQPSGSSLQQLLSGAAASSRSSESGVTSSLTGKTPSTGTEDMYEDFGRLVVDQGSGPRVDRGFWSIFCDEVEHIFQAIQDGSDVPGTHVSLDGKSEGSPIAAHCHGYIFGMPCATVAEDEDLYPLPSQVPFLWTTFVERVDSFVKILHVPSVEAIISRAKGKLNHQDHGAGVEALLFAVCFAAIVSLDAVEVSDAFRISKGEMVSRLRLGTERALGRTQFATTSDVVVVQALTIYLFMLPHTGAARLAFTLTGSLVRMATSIGLHRDPLDGNPSHLPVLTGIEMETRRRLWWHILFLDSRGQTFGAPGHGTAISQDSFTTRIPTNADDEALSMTPLSNGNNSPEEKRGLTHSTLTVIRCKLWQLRTSFSHSREQPLEWQLQKANGTKAEIEGTYLSETPPTHMTASFSSFLATITSLFFAKIEAEIYRQHLRRHGTSNPHHASSVQNHLFTASVSVLESTRALCSNPAWHNWRWQLQGSFPWRAVGSVFISLCQSPSWTADSERAWQLARGLLENLPDESKGQDMWRRLEELASKAGVHRRRQLRQIEKPPAAAPVIGSGWELVAPRDGTGEELPSGLDRVVSRQEETVVAPRTALPTGELEAQILLADDLPVETANIVWEPGMYAADELMADWANWDDVVDMDMFDF